MSFRCTCAVLVLLVAPVDTALAGGAGPDVTRTSSPVAPLTLSRTYVGPDFRLAYPQGYTARPFADGVALVAPGRGDVLTASVLPRPANARTLSPEAYARQFAPLNIQGAEDLLSFRRLVLSGGNSAWVGTWRGMRGTLGPLYLVPLDAGAQRWLMLSAATPTELALLDVVARSVRIGR